MKRVIHGIIAILALMILTGCAELVDGAKTGAEMSHVANDAVTVSDKVDVVQDKYGQYSDQKAQLAALDKLQEKIHYAVKGDVSPTRVWELREEGLQLYDNFSVEIVSKWPTIPEPDRVTFLDIDADLRTFDRRLLNVLTSDETAETSELLLNLLNIASGARQMYDLYEKVSDY